MWALDTVRLVSCGLSWPSPYMSPTTALTTAAEGRVSCAGSDTHPSQLWWVVGKPKVGLLPSAMLMRKSTKPG
jgi:hypothetical protein